MITQLIDRFINKKLGLGFSNVDFELFHNNHNYKTSYFKVE
jgi:hypothetical protein